MKLPTVPWLAPLNAKLEGAPNQTLTILLLVLAAALIVAALKGSPIAKASLITWVVLP